MAGSTLVRVTVTHDFGVQKFEQDLKKAVLEAGIDAKHTVFLLKDAQVRRAWHATSWRWLSALEDLLAARFASVSSISRNVCLALWLCRMHVRRARVYLESPFF